ncbi:hypothetical protein GF314_09445 [bacterium]|nr:hypothetical protein [bacterium]
MLLNSSVLGAPDMYNCSYHYTFVIDGQGIVAYRGSVNLPAIEIVLDDAIARLDDPQTSVDGLPDARPLLGANYPNPFNPTTTVPYLVPERLGQASVQLDVLDLRGRIVRTLVSGVRAAGEHTATFDGRDDGGDLLASGSYLARLRVDGQETTRIMTLVK